MGYEFLSRIRYSEVDQNERLTIDHLADYFQDCTIYHDDSVGLGLAYWRERGAMWVTTSWKVLFFDMPHCCDYVKVRTDAINCRSFVGVRNFTLRSESGKMLAAAFGKFALLDARTGKPVRIRPEEGDAYGRSDPIPMEEEKQHIVLPADAEEKEPIVVGIHHLDPNHHVNNVQYIIMAMNYLPEGFTPKMMRFSYHLSALLGDVIIPKIAYSEHDVTGMLMREDGEMYAAFRFSDVLSEQDEKVAEL